MLPQKSSRAANCSAVCLIDIWNLFRCQMFLPEIQDLKHSMLVLKCFELLLKCELTFFSFFSVLLVCWVKDIKRFALQFENSVQIHDAISGPGVQTRTCVNKNDSVVYHRKKKYNASFRVLLKSPAAKRVPFVFR